MRQASALYRLLGDEARLRLLRVLARERLNVTELTGVLGLAQSGVSRHLGLLKDAGLVAEERDGGFSYYRLAPALDSTGDNPLAAMLRAQFNGPDDVTVRRSAVAGGAPAAEGEFRQARGARYPRRPAARARPQLGGLVEGARVAAAAAQSRGSRMRRGVPHDRGRPMGNAGDRRRSIPRRAGARPRACAAAARVERDLEAG